MMATHENRNRSEISTSVDLLGRNAVRETRRKFNRFF